VARKTGKRIRIASDGSDDGVVISVPVGRYKGSFDLLEGGIARATITHASEFAPPSIDIFVDDELIRDDAAPADIRDARLDDGHVVSATLVDLPPKFSGRNFVLTARLAGTTDEIARTSFENPVHWMAYSERVQLRVDRIDTDDLSGWVIDRLDTDAVVTFDVMLNDVLFQRIDNSMFRPDLAKREISPTGRGGFHLKFPTGLFAPNGASVSLRFPDGSILYRQSVAAQGTQRNLLAVVGITAPLKIIVPIFNAFDDVVICMERLLEYTPRDVGIILIDDASTDPRIRAFLGSFADRENIELILSDENRGFTRSVNAGIAAAKDCDVILLNSDARVTPGWVAGLRRAAGSDERICTVTPMSDRAGAFSAPQIGNENRLPHGVSEPEFAMAFRRRAKGLYPAVPTGNGFCMYVRRAAIREIGMLDDVAFPRGYGEENDFCMRAERAGWRHVIDDRTYVFHERSKSFGSAKDDLMLAGRKVVDHRYPEYGRRVQVFSRDEQIRMSRFSASVALADAVAPTRTLPRILFVISTMSGGTPQTNRDLMRGVSGSWEPWLLHCDSKTISLYKVDAHQDQLYQRHSLSELLDPISYRSFEYETVVRGWLNFYEFDIVHIRHLAWHSIEFPRIARESGSSVVMSFHDYHALCPTVKLIDGDGQFCGGVCTATDGDCKHVLWPEHQFPTLKNAWVHEWRKKYACAMAHCDLFITTSAFAKSVIVGNLKIDPERFLVIPHGRDFAEFGATVTLPSQDQKLKVLIPGHIDAAKGADILLALVEMDAGEHLEFHILGPETFPPIEGRITFHGAYKRENFLAEARKINAHVGAIFSTWDETWCHTLTELWSTGLPVAVLDYPTLAKRVTESGGGWVLPKDDLPAVYNALVEMKRDQPSFFAKLGSVQAWQRGLGRASTTRLMSAQYELGYKHLLRERQGRMHMGATGGAFGPILSEADMVAVVCPASKDQLQANASTHIRVWEKTLNGPDRNFQYVRMTPDELVAAVAIGQISRGILQRNVMEPRHWRELKGYVERGEFSYLLDIDDDLLNVPQEKDENGWYRSTRDCLAEVIRSAARVLVSTPELERRLSTMNRNVVLEENALSNRIWRRPVDVPPASSVRRALYMGTASHLDDLRMIVPALARLAEEDTSFRLKVIGVLKSGETTLPWVEIVDIPSALRNYPEFVGWLKGQAGNCDFGIAPLENSEFNDCKSPLKVLEYAGLGLPVVASMGQVYDKACEEAPFASAVNNSEADWYAALRHMTEMSKESLREQGQAMRDWVFSQKNLDATIERFDEFVGSLVPPLSNG
jgi:GT2 family glycosyltransferase/glycosyltransferase involved in cell wall biosynthesis